MSGIDPEETAAEIKRAALALRYGALEAAAIMTSLKYNITEFHHAVELKEMTPKQKREAYNAHMRKQTK